MSYIQIQEKGTYSSQLSSVLLLKGYSSVNLFHGLTHCETVLDSLSRDQVCRPLANIDLASSETTAWQQYIGVNWSKYETALKKSQIMLRTAPNFSNNRNRIPAHISRHITFDIVAYLPENITKLTIWEAFLVVGNPCESITECSRVRQ